MARWTGDCIAWSRIKRVRGPSMMNLGRQLRSSVQPRSGRFQRELLGLAVGSCKEWTDEKDHLLQLKLVCGVWDGFKLARTWRRWPMRNKQRRLYERVMCSSNKSSASLPSSTLRAVPVLHVVDLYFAFHLFQLLRDNYHKHANIHSSIALKDVWYPRLVLCASWRFRFLLYSEMRSIEFSSVPMAEGATLIGLLERRHEIGTLNLCQLGQRLAPAIRRTDSNSTHHPQK